MKFKEMHQKIETLESFTKKLSLTGIEDLSIKVDNMKFFLLKVE